MFPISTRPAGPLTETFSQRLEQSRVQPAETGVAHDEDLVPGAGEAHHLIDDGVGAWTDADSVIKVYFLATARGRLDLGLNAMSGPSTCSLRVACADQEFIVDVGKSDEYVDVPVGTVTIRQVGYQTLTVKGLKKSGGAYFPGLRELVVSGPAARGPLPRL